MVNDNWYKFNGKIYEEVKPKVIGQKILNFLDNYIVLDSEGNPTKPYASNSCVNEVFNWFKKKFPVESSEVNIGGMPLNNGILVVTENNGKIDTKLESYGPNKYFTYCSEVKYNPKANLTEAYKLL